MMKCLFYTAFLLLVLAPGTQADCVVKEKLYTISSAHEKEIYGFADAEGHVVVKPEHLMVKGFGDYGYGYADGYWIGLHGEKLLKAYPYNGYPDVPSEGEGLMRYLGGDDKLGFVDRCLTVAIPARFDYVSRFYGGVALACIGCDINTRDEDPEFGSWAHKKWGIIDKTGKLVVPMQYSYDQAFDIASKMASPTIANCPRHDKLYTFDNGDLIGYKDKSGRVVIPPRYGFAMDFTDYGYGYADGYWIGLHGEKLYKPFIYDNGPDTLSDGLMRYVKDGKVGFLNECLDAVIPARFDHAEPFGRGFAPFCNGCVSVPVDKDGEYHMMQGGKWGVIDKKGQVVVPMIYSHEEAIKKADEIRAAPAPE